MPKGAEFEVSLAPMFLLTQQKLKLIDFVQRVDD